LACDSHESGSWCMMHFHREGWWTTPIVSTFRVEGEVVTTRRSRRHPHSLKRFRLQALEVYPYCQWCQCPLAHNTATTDHLIPLSRGGTNAWENLCLACHSCNQARRNNLPHREPSGPRWGTGIPLSVLALPSKPLFVAWTRYPGGRWRSTFRNISAESLRDSLNEILGASVEHVILPDGELPIAPEPHAVS
jgi:hypothetical protein